jgi:ComF family protein
VLLAPACAACAAMLASPLAGPVCPACWRTIRFITPPVCPRCGAPLAAAGRHHRCDHPPPHVDTLRAAGLYDGSLRAIIHAFKYDRRRSLAAPLAGLLRFAAGPQIAHADAVVPVPLHWQRRLHRGFNQSADLARHLGLPVLPLLRRARRTGVQAALPAEARRHNVAGAFRVRPLVRWAPPTQPPRVVRGRDAARGARLLLVDDVATTGSTLDACAAALKAAGAREVHAVTLARVAGSAWR